MSVFVTIGELMPRHLPLSSLVLLIFFILVIQVVAVYWHLYFYIWWLDIPVHILGGLWVALFGLATYFSSSLWEDEKHFSAFVIVFAVAITMTIGLGWEIYEFAVEHAVGDSGTGLADSLKDLTDDLIGALLGALVFIRGGYNKQI